MAHEFHSFYYDQLQREPVTDDFTLPGGTVMDAELLRQLIDEYRENHVPRYEYLDAAYKTKFAIFGRDPKPDYKPDNRLAADMAYDITQTFEGTRQKTTYERCVISRWQIPITYLFTI